MHVLTTNNVNMLEKYKTEFKKEAEKPAAS